MKKTIYIFLAFAFSLFTFHCGDNPVSPPTSGNPPVVQDSLVGSFDSLCVFANPVNAVWDTKYLLPDSLVKFKITFDSETNLADSTGGRLWIEIRTTIGGGILYDWLSPAINKTWVISDSTSIPFGSVAFTTSIFPNNDFTKYVKLKNVKLFKRN